MKMCSLVTIITAMTLKWCITCIIITTNVTGRHWGPKRKLVLNVQHIFANSFVPSPKVTGYSFPFHVHIMCIWYGTVLANTAVLCMCLLVCGAPCECCYNILLHCKEYFSLSSVVLHAFSALCVYSKFGHHPHPLGHFCAKFHFFCSIHCWASPFLCTQLLIHSLNHPAYLMPQEMKLALRNNSNNNNIHISILA